MIIKFKKKQKRLGVYTWNEGWGRGVSLFLTCGTDRKFFDRPASKKGVKWHVCIETNCICTERRLRGFITSFYSSHCIQSAIDFLTHNLIYSYTEQCTCAQSYHHRYIFSTHIYVTLYTSSPLLKIRNYLFK